MEQKIKRGRDKFKRVKPLILILVRLSKMLPLPIRKKLLEIFRMTQGYIGLTIRYILFKSIAKKCGDNVAIHPNVYMFYPENISVDSNVTFHPMCYIDGSGFLEIGSDVSIAHGVTIMTQNHNYKEIEIPIPDQGLTYSSVRISNNVWIGAKSTILYGRKIGTGSIIGANSLVSKDVEDYTIVGGIPAKVLRNRNEQ